MCNYRDLMLLGVSIWMSAALVAAQNKPANPNPAPATPAATPAPAAEPAPVTPAPAPVAGQTPPAQPGPAPAAQAPIPSGPQPKLTLDRETWNFGSVWMGEPLEAEITISNSGTAPMTLQVQSSCGCTAVRKPKELLSPGESDKLVIKYDSKKNQRQVNQSVTLTTNDPTKPVTRITVTGEVKPIIETVPNTGILSITFGRITSDAATPKALDLKVAYNEKLDLKLKPGPTGPFDVKLETIAAGQSYRLIATPKPPLPNGPAIAEARLETGLKSVPEIAVPINGVVSARVAVYPDNLFVPTQLTRPTERIVNVTYQASKPVKITEVKSDNEAIKATVTEQTVPAGVQSPEFKTYNIRVTLPAGNEIPEAGNKLTILTDDPEFPKFELPITNKPPVARMAPGVAAATQPAGAAAGVGPVAPVQPAPPVAPVPPKPAEPAKPSGEQPK